MIGLPSVLTTTSPACNRNNPSPKPSPSFPRYKQCKTRTTPSPPRSHPAAYPHSRVGSPDCCGVVLRGRRRGGGASHPHYHSAPLFPLQLGSNRATRKTLMHQHIANGDDGNHQPLLDDGDQSGHPLPTASSRFQAQVAGWPPVRSFRRNALKTCKYVKVAVDGAPYLRKVDLETYADYHQLLTALKEMFSCFTVRNLRDERRLVDPVSGTEYVPTYEDKEGDWMLIGDVPWKMFIESCKRLRLMKKSEAVNLGNDTWIPCETTTKPLVPYVVVLDWPTTPLFLPKLSGSHPPIMISCTTSLFACICCHVLRE